MRSLSLNHLGAAGAAALAPALAANGSLTSLNLGDNQLCGLDRFGRGTYTADGITAIADALRVNGALTECDLRFNPRIGEEGEALIRKAWEGKDGFRLHI